MAKRVTLKDLSDRLGLSQNTISLVLRDMPGISETTRQTVLRVAEEMGYNGKKRRTEMPHICVLTTYANNTDAYFFGRLQNKIEYCLKERCCPTITINNVETYPLETIEELCAANDISGIIMVADIGRELVEKIKGLALPILCAGFYVPGIQVDSVLEDNISGMEMIARHLCKEGCKRAGFIGPIRPDQGFFERWMAFSAIAERYGIVVDSKTCLLDIDYADFGNVEQAAQMIHALPALPEAFVCANDRIAMSVIKALQYNGRRVPEDVGVIGFDNSDLAQLCTPTLATVDNFVEEQAVCAVERLLKRITQPGMPFQRILCRTEFVAGDSFRTAK